MVTLYSYYRSSASYRVRIALNYKQIAYDLVPINLLTGEHLGENFLGHNKQGRVPTLNDNQFEIGQSSAILEYLEEKYPEPALLPHKLESRAWVRYLSQLIISDIHPLNNSSVLKYLAEPVGLNQDTIQQWYHHWVKLGFESLENILSKHPDCKNFCWGDQPTFADLCLIPQVYNAHRFKLPMDTYPTLCRIYEHCLTLPYFEKARPENQPDCNELKNKAAIA